MTAYDEVIKEIGGDTFEGIVFAFRNIDYEGKHCYVPERLCNRVLVDLEVIKHYMDKWSYNGGYGGEECPPTTIWTDKRVIFVCCYDGSTWLQSVPRNPTNHNPSFCGGG